MNKSTTILVSFIVITLIFLVLVPSNVEGFDWDKNSYLWYRTPYSIWMWDDAKKRHKWWNLSGRRRFLTMNSYMYTPPNYPENMYPPNIYY